MIVLGISALFHDAAAALVRDGEILAAAQEERFSRRKHDPDLPRHAIVACLAQAGLEASDIEAVVFYEKPISAYARVVKTLVHEAPRGFGQFRRAVPGWLRHKLWVGYELQKLLAELGHPSPPEVLYAEHHQSHAASAFLASPFDEAAIITLDGVGEWDTTSISHGSPDGIVALETVPFPHSLGLLYSAFTHQCGFRVNSGEYKLMGLAPYGSPTYRDRILEELIDLRDDGSYHLDVRSLGYLSGLRMTNRRFERLFDGPARKPEDPITRREADLARSIQEVTEQVVLAVARRAAAQTGSSNVCLAGGVALNAVANGRLLREGPFDDVWVQPAAGDAGGALGAALLVSHQRTGRPRPPTGGRDAMAGCLLGPSFTTEQVDDAVARSGRTAEVLEPAHRAGRVATLLADGAVVGVHDGRMEFGPRALGNRSILADARSATAQERVNARIKQREGFRPFAPAVLAEKAADWFDVEGELPYMTFVAPVSERRRTPDTGDATWPPELRVKEVRSEIPAVTHVDHSARIQTVSRDRHPRFHELLQAFDERTGCPVVLNTSLNVRGEPVACTPEDALRLLDRTDLDHLVIGDHLITRQR